jgi:glycosyltransferase involved in cell wall biosynthesis
MKGHLKIAMVAACPFPWPRGTPVRIYRLAEALSQRSHEVHVMTYHLGDRSISTPFKIHRIPEIRSYSKYSPGPTIQKLLLLDFLLGAKLLNFLKANQIDIVHAHHYEGLLVSSAVCAWTKHPWVYDAHTLLESELPSYRLGLPSWLKKSIGRSIDRRSPPLAFHVITVTADIREQLIREGRVTPDKVTVITNGVEWQRFRVQKQTSHGASRNTRRLVFTGNLAHYQGIDLLLKAFHEVVKKRKDVRLVIITDSDFDPYEPVAEAMGIRNRVDIIQANFEKVPEHLEGADVLLNPRVQCDGIPQKLLNYMAAGKPIVSFAGSAKIVNNEKTALVVEDKNVTAFAQAVLRLLADPLLSKELGANAQRLVTSKFTWEIAAIKAEAVYGTVLREGKKWHRERST